jgi:hypothetical protein
LDLLDDEDIRVVRAQEVGDLVHPRLLLADLREVDHRLRRHRLPSGDIGALWVVVDVERRHPEHPSQCLAYLDRVLVGVDVLGLGAVGLHDVHEVLEVEVLLGRGFFTPRPVPVREGLRIEASVQAQRGEVVDGLQFLLLG